MSYLNLEDDDLEALVSSGVIQSYTFTENYNESEVVSSQSFELTFPGGQKLLVGSWSTPAPESSGLTVEAVIPKE